MGGPLADLQVVDVTTGIAGPYCTKLFADAGAEVIKIEPVTGDPLRRYAATIDVPPGEDGALFRYLNAGKHSISSASLDRGFFDQPPVDRLLAGADLFVEDLPSGRIDVDALRARHPHLVITSITPFGRTGPFADRPATDLTLQAESGALLYKGDRSLPPVQAGGRVSEFFGGLFAAPGALAAVLRARDTGLGEHVDVSIQHAMALVATNYMHLVYEITGRPPITAPSRFRDTPGIEAAADGLVGFNTNSAQMLQMFLLMVERPELMDDPQYRSFQARVDMGESWQRIVDDWIGRHTVHEVIERAAALRIAVAPVHDAKTIVDDEHLRERGVFVTGDDGMLRPRPPYLIDGEAMDATRAAPRLGEHNGVDFARPARSCDQQSGTSAHGASRAASSLPLAGLKVVDLTSWWVGAFATQHLAMLGADVIHIEGVAHPDGMRLTGSAMARTPDWWEWGHMFTAANANKRGITLDLSTDAGRALLDRLIDWGDVLVENFSPRVAEAWGLTRDAVLARWPNLIYQRMPAYGLTGPWRDRPAFAQTIEPMSGMAAITGQPDARPEPKGGLPDPIAGTHGAWAFLVSLAHRRRSGHGVFCESVMIEAALNVVAQPIVEYSAYGRVMSRLGNRSPHAAPQGVYAAEKGDAPESYLAISVTDDAQWTALAEIVGGADLARDPRFVTAADRHLRHDALDDLLATWAAGRDARASAEQLRARGVPAAMAWDPRLIEEHPQLTARDSFAEVEHPVLGSVHTLGLPYRYSSIDRWVHWSAPTFGQHNVEVLGDVLGISDTEIESLFETGVIADRPRGL